MTERPKPCPCCQCRIVTAYAEGDTPRLLGLTCDACGLRTLPYSDPGRALAVWNRREPRRPRTVVRATQEATQ